MYIEQGLIHTDAGDGPVAADFIAAAHAGAAPPSPAAGVKLSK
jgi:hypothetical protein